MTYPSWEKVREVLDVALDLDGSRRAVYLKAACAGDSKIRREVESLLAHEEPANDFIEEPIAPSCHQLVSEEREALPEIAGYEILHEIGQGGMARVYEARRNEKGLNKRRVAIKILRRHMLNVDENIDWRFQHERRILASLEHPNIARIFDGGTTEGGLPYFVMEYVEGELLDTYCNSRRLDLGRRIEIFRKICSAVEYAHHKMVVHRDLKPGNILVTAGGEPKLLDFGIAKLLDLEENRGDTTWHMTLPGLQPMTPSYASPEQFKCETITTASDVYSLGVVLYELLTGHNPHRVEEPKLEQYRQAVVLNPPELPSQVVSRSAIRWTSHNSTTETAPSAIAAERGIDVRHLHRQLSGDLDSILCKTLRKESAARYRSATDLSEDLENSLAGRPVRARQQEFWYHIRKLIHMHRFKVIAFLAFFFAATAALLGYNLQQAALLEERDLVIGSLLTGLISSTDINVSNPFDDFLGQNTSEIFARFNRMGKDIADQGDLDVAERIIRRTIELKEEMLEGDERKKSIALSLHNLAAILTEKGEFEEARTYHDQVIAMHEEIDEENPLHLLRALNNRAVYYQDLGLLDQAEQDLTKLFKTADLKGFDEPHMLPFRNNLAYLYLLQAKAKPGPETQKGLLEAERILLEVHAQVQGARPEFSVLKNLAEAQALLGKSEALANARRAHELVSRRYLSKEIAEVESVLGTCLADAGEDSEAAFLLKRAHNTLTFKLGENNLKAQEAQQRLEAVQTRLETNPPPSAPTAGSPPPNSADPPR